jgi:hypothetical protein
MHPLEVMIWGFLGSTAVELMSLLGYYTSRRGLLPHRYRRAGFWVTRFVLALVAGALALAYDIQQRILAFNIGASTPLILTFIARGLRQPPPETVVNTEPPERVSRERPDAPVEHGPVQAPRRGPAAR